MSYGYNVAGQLNSFSGNIGDGTTRNYITSATYTAAGNKEREVYGMTTPLYLNLAYNKRQQMVDLRLSSTTDPQNWNRGALITYYGTNSVNIWNPFADDTDNNGNVRRSLHYVPLNDANTSSVIPQLADYTYDGLNRLGTYTEAQHNGSAWTLGVDGQTFSYDQYGNRKITSTVGGVNGYNPNYTATSNRIVGLTYDSAGNITNDGVKTMTYDAENRMVAASGAGGTGTYVYDGGGKRVKRATSTQSWWYVYGLGGELVAEYLSTAPTAVVKEYGYRSGQLLVVGESGNVRWIVTDHLGSTRMTADSTGSLAGIKRQDYLPFGEDLYVGIRRNGANGQYGYEPPLSTIRHKFTGKERDTETGLDFFGARYMSSTQGRFTSVDPLRASAHIASPQTFNRYSYVLNRPTMAVDPDGLSTIVVTVTQNGNAEPTATVKLMSSTSQTNYGLSHEGAGGVYEAKAAGSVRDRTAKDRGDTPFGTYRRREVGTEKGTTQGGTDSDRKGIAYGTGKVLMDPVAGEVIDAGRNQILLHGGGSAVTAAEGGPYFYNQPLKYTQGCVRMHNMDVNALIQNIKKLEGTNDSLDRIFIGTRETLLALAELKDANGNYVNPDLRIALGLFKSQAELDALVRADQARREREARERQTAEDERQRKARETGR